MNSLPKLKPRPWPGQEDLLTLREAFRAAFDDVTSGDPLIVASLAHVLAHPGHLGRAATCLAVGRGVGLETNRTLKLAIGVEYLHTASLVFDDLPCMDNASTRRHAPCVHRVHGESTAILSALALVNRAYTLIWEGLAGGEIRDRLRAGEYLDSALGVFGLLGGQSRDLHDVEAHQSTTGVRQIATMKTVPLLRVAVVLPVIISGGSRRLVQLLERYCLFRGLAYQIADDLKDLSGTGLETGKTSGRDADLGRPNLALAGGFEAAIAELQHLNRLGDRALRALPGGWRQWGFLDRLRPEVPTASPPPPASLQMLAPAVSQ